MSTSASPSSGGSKTFAQLQRLGKSLMLPIAVLPAAALPLRLGQDDLIGAIPGMGEVGAVISSAGGALFDNLPLLFAIGVAIGFAKKADGSTALAGAVGYLVLSGVLWGMTDTEASTVYNKGPYGVLGGIIAGLVAAGLWQRYHRIKLPSYLGFFGGRRFVPIVTSGVMLVIGVVLGLIYPYFDLVLTGFGEAVTGSAVAGGGIYGVVNRMLLPFGLHHIPNSVVWFLTGDYQGERGDINRFFAGDPTAGTFMAGFFPIFMFALPAAALAIYHCAKPAQRKVVGGIMFSTALTAFLTGVTEPLEFSFIFVAWPLLIVHAVLTGTSMALVNWLDIHHGFVFSAGGIDYLLNFGIAQKPLWLIPIGLGYAVIYYFLFRFIITRMNLPTPGREEDEDTEGADSEPSATPSGSNGDSGTPKTGGT
ncbi:MULTISPECIES: PTS transporter subunit EIIC [unclassified Actinopolyspora]|uniref:PTS transporter subunit EIIC n=1 Tax=unclassified Actinopolyspora TaxID=2639451 RepID=UPI0013F67503|nr:MULTISPECIES: PTS transporter subunit EIIC [unclassified Actinopolyspora]NHD17534.1 PTS transporter subunit EIIC [Actinopolyspora sp. BKK2]NHE76733.1 PTS transporter subunit EIIC [Actinopolyspora sp. BKK1]